MTSKFVKLSIYGKLYFLWILCIVKLSKGTSITLTCPAGWVLSGTMCYRLYGQDTLTSSTWDNAYRVCKGNGAELVTIDDYFTNQNVGDFASARNTNKFWTGMSEKGVTTQNGIATTWNMNTAASIYQGRWSVRNPDTTYGDCVYVEKKDREYVWTVGSCLMKMTFVCQRTSCLPQSFHCDNGRCVNPNWRCDGVDDCGDLSDEVECAGRCSYLLDTASSGRIQSPNHPSNYLPSRVCTWTIVGPEGSNIYLEFTSFNTEKDTDIVEVLIGGRTESTARSVARLSGQPSLSTARYRSYNNYMIIRFSTDSQTEKVGFTATYNSSRDSYPNELYMTARTTVSTLEPPLFSSHGSNAYLGNRDYVWIIRAEEGRKIVTLERMKIDLTGDDVIEIRDGDSGSAPLLEKYTASNNDNVDLPLSQSKPVMGKRFVFSTSNVMYVIMRTSGSTSGTGFSFQYKQGCIARYTADAGEITSPGYPNVNYANFQTCTWTIDIPSGKGVKVMLDRSEGVEIADNEDFIQIYTNSTDDSGNAAHGSGAGFTTISLSNDQPFHSPNGKMFIRFKSTAITNKKGFQLLYSIDCPDPALTEASELNPSQTAVQLRQFDNDFTVSCRKGYSFQSDELNLRSARMKCMYGGKWLVEQRTRTIPQCKPNYCGEPVAVENGYISKSNGVVFGSFVTFTCFPGFSLLGSANITCQSSQWTSRPQCVSANCPAPPTISNGQLSSTNNQYAAIVNYTCNAGYQLIGAPILFCQSSGQWTASAPQCIKVTCPIPGIKNGRVSSSTLPQFQESLTVSCDVGYMINGSATITCGKDRSFDVVPNCIGSNDQSNIRICTPGFTGEDCSVMTEINECDAEPCMHGGNCTDRVNDFQCTCPEGWTGKRCEMIYDECTVNNKCPSSAQCLNIFKKSYCKCPKNTYGEVCENSPDICHDLRPCLNSATCTAGVNALSKCTCPNDDYRGIGCEITVNHCDDPNKCENGGTCINLAPGFRCDCPPGYSGANCSINVNDCSNTCPSTSACIDMGNAHYCRCPLGKTGESCVRDLDTNYDLYFYLTSKDGYAALPYPIYLSGSSFSLSVWVRFYHSSLTGTFLTIFTAKSANSLAGVTKFLSLDHQGLVVYDKSGQNPQRAAYQQQTVTDGQWNYVVVSWNKDNGFDLVVNSLRQSQIPTTPYTSMMAENIWVTLGADFDSAIMPKATDGFRGYVSQLNIYNRGLSFENEMPQLIPDPRKVFSGSILRWNEFVHHRGVQPVYPSSAQKPCTGANCNTYNKKFPIFKTPCPSNVYKVSADRLTSVTWTEPIPEGATVQENTYKSGDTFLWGKYTNTYAIRDAANSSASCSFNIYVMREQCSDPNPPHLGTRTCERSYNPYFGCTIGCTDANRRIDRYTPKVYTCGPSGAWNPSNRNVPLRFPSCGLVQNQARRRLVIDLAYPNISTSFCEGVKDTLALKLKQAFASIDTRWSNQICGQPDCSDVTFVINCQANSNGRRKRQTTISPTSVDITIPTSLATLTRSSPAETLTVEEILTRSVLESQLFDFSTTIPNGSPDLNSFTIDSSESCPSGETVVDGYCVKCGPGNFFNSSTLVCEDCPVGTYQNQDDQTSCTPCPQGSTTQTVASPSSSDCKAICNPGHYQTGTRCDPCGVGFYQSQSGMFYCDPCPVGQTTRGTTSTSASECYNDCNPGYELSSNGVCVQCAIGTYRILGTPAVCVACPSDKTTAAKGSTKETDCSLTSCLQGYRRDGVPGTCFRCEKGTYQDEKWQTACKSCGGVRYMTMNDASTQKSDCIFFCESGQEVDNSTGTLTCVNCPVGTYKDNTVDPTSKCTSCPGGKLTPTTASDSINDCSIFRCGAGYRPNATRDGCDPCPYGTYQPLADQENCTMCGSGYSTYQMASTQSTDCKVYCDSGKIRNEQSQTCEVCPVGYYKTNTDYKFNNCTRCPENYVTPTTGSDNLADCTVRDCPAGTKRQTGDTGCDGCLRGQYQPQPYQTSCIGCPANTFTRYVNSTKATDCETFCPSGEEKKGGVCMQCTIGYFKDNNVDKFSECTLCPAQSITANNGSTSQSDCNIANCSAGYYRDTVSNTCLQCAKGSYQPTQWQTSCIQCPTDKTTETTGASSLNMCQLQCSPGYEDINGKCEKCKKGFYKAEYAAALCKECPTGFITSEEGTVDKGNCTVPACDPGYYLTNNNCEKCPYDKYQPEKWQSSCIQCPTNYVTQKQGATNVSDCVVDCTSGDQYRPVEKDCIGCERGYYRDKTVRSQIKCQMCPVEFITAGERATGVAACTVKNCTAPGQYRNPSTNVCTNCPVGTYNNVKWLDSCTNCSLGFTTKQTGTTTSNDCIRDCPSGEYELQGVCVKCAVGTYRDKSEGFDCKRCSSGYTTPGTGATSRANCSITNCIEGEYFDSVGQKCEQCANGTYQDQPRSVSCKPCGTAGYYTKQKGSKSSTDCKFFCDPGNHNCHLAAKCTPTVSSFTCTCNPDFQGDGTNCTHMCDLGYCVYGSCIKSPKLSCQCNKGYTGTRCEVRLDPSKESQKQNETVIIASVTAGAILMILAILIVCCVVRARKRPEKYARQTEYTGAPVMMDKHSLYNQSFAPGPYDNFSMRSYSPGASYRGVATMPELGYDNTGYGGDPAVYQA